MCIRDSRHHARRARPAAGDAQGVHGEARGQPELRPPVQRHVSNPRAVIADDEPLMRAQLRERLREAWPELDIVAEAKNGAEAVALVAAQRPDFVFLDIRMPVKSGLEAAQAIARLGGTLPAVVFVTAYDQHAIDAFENLSLIHISEPTRL